MNGSGLSLISTCFHSLASLLAEVILPIVLQQERLWKRTAARVFAYAAAAVGRKGGLRATPLGNQIRADTITATAQVPHLPCSTTAHVGELGLP